MKITVWAITFEQDIVDISDLLQLFFIESRRYIRFDVQYTVLASHHVTYGMLCKIGHKVSKWVIYFQTYPYIYIHINIDLQKKKQCDMNNENMLHNIWNIMGD